MKRSLYRRAFEYWQNGPGHPYTCHNSHSLKLHFVDGNAMHLRCDKCPDYHQVIGGDRLVTFYENEYLKKRKFKVEIITPRKDRFVRMEKRKDVILSLCILGYGFSMYFTIPHPYDNLVI